MTIIARLTSPQPVLGASVQVTLGENFSLLDNGFNGDENAMDGIYSAKVFAPNFLTFDLLVTASASGFEPVSKTIPVKTIFRPQKLTYECPACGLTRHEPDAVHCKHCGNIVKIETEGEG